MTETLHNRPVDRDKLSAALKRNMARRKEVASHQSTVISEAQSIAEMGVRSAAREPRSGWGQRSVGGKEAPSIKGEAS